ncbi:MAG: lysine--tRNA ligase [Myxococcota bacterium]
MANEDELMAARRTKAEALVAAGTRAFPNDFRPSEADREARAAVVALAHADDAARSELPEESALTGDEATHPLYGRVMAKRGPFLVLRTPHGDAQALVRKDALPEDQAAMLKAVDLADHVAVRGPLIKTRTGALAVSARSYQHVGKALLPPPAKWHGLKDVEKRYRERYVDLFANPSVAAVFRARALMVKTLRRFLDDRDYLEVETPMLHSVRGGAAAKPFSTHHNALDMGLYLRIAPELYLKRLVVGGFDRVYEIGRNFRNEGISTKHNPEFTMLELYQAYASFEELMDLSEAMLRAVDAAVREAHPELVGERSFTLGEPFARVPMRDSILAAAGLEANAKLLAGASLDRATLDDEGALVAFAETLAPRLPPADRKGLAGAPSHGHRLLTLYEVLAEENLAQLYRNGDGTKSVPVFITDYPASVSPLSRRKDDDPEWVDRFELFIEGREVANAFSELNDPDDQAERFRAQLDDRAKGDDEAMDFDADYVRALSHGMPPAAGLGLGVDRLVMFLCDQPSIRDVLLFPLLRPEA